MRTSGEVLEFEGVRDLIGRYMSTDVGRRELAKLEPIQEREPLESDLADAGEAIEYLRTASRPQTAGRGAAIRIDFGGLPDTEPAVHKLRIEGASLEPREIFGVFALLDRAADAKSLLTAASPRFPRLGERAQTIGDFRTLLRELDGKILPDGSVSDHASVALNRLRREIERQKKAIQESLERFLKAHRDDGILQEEFVTIRNERFVVPLIAGQRRKLDGVIHGASASGHTLFVEPLETIDLNNELARLADEEAREVHRILREMTDHLRGYGDSIRATLLTMAALEVIFAKARFAVDFDCVIPRFGQRILLRDARHPLLEDVLRRNRKKVVPISLELTQESRTLLISGPNTGGKTVTLKTVGLLSLMAQSALPVPAGEAEFPLFEQVLADIGDYQSIQENLSTFSAHVSNIREMALDVTPASLVLLDELGRRDGPRRRRRVGSRDCRALPRGRRVHVDFDAPDGAKDLRRVHRRRGQRFHGFRREHVRADVSSATRIARQIGWSRNRYAPRDAGRHHAARAPLDERPRTRRDSLPRRAASQDRRDAVARRRTARAKLAELEKREKEIAHEWERRESAKLKELERRTDMALAKFEEQAHETISRIAQSADKRKAEQEAQRHVAKTKREMREDFETTVLATEDDSRQGRITPYASKKARAYACAMCASPRACAANSVTTSWKWKPGS